MGGGGKFGPELTLHIPFFWGGGGGGGGMEIFSFFPLLSFRRGHKQFYTAFFGGGGLREQAHP